MNAYWKGRRVLKVRQYVTRYGVRYAVIDAMSQWRDTPGTMVVLCAEITVTL